MNGPTFVANRKGPGEKYPVPKHKKFKTRTSEEGQGRALGWLSSVSRHVSWFTIGVYSMYCAATICPFPWTQSQFTKYPKATLLMCTLHRIPAYYPCSLFSANRYCPQPIDLAYAARHLLLCANCAPTGPRTQHGVFTASRTLCSLSSLCTRSTFLIQCCMQTTLCKA